MLSIGLVELLRFPWERRVVLGIFPALPVLAEYNSALPGEAEMGCVSIILRRGSNPPACYDSFISRASS